MCGKKKEAIFGKAKFIDKENDLYPIALEMYCRAKMLSHPETYTDKPTEIESLTSVTLNPLNKV